MAGAMRKVGEYLGLVEQADFDEYDDEPTGPVPAVRREEERTPAVRAPERRAQVASIDDHRRTPRAVEPAPSMLARIETVTPRTYNDARTVGEHYRSGVPVIMNLSEIDDDDAKRLVDFVENGFCLRERIGKGFAHSNALTALAGKCECNGHLETPP